MMETLVDLGAGIGMTAIGAGIALGVAVYGTAMGQGIAGSSAVGVVAEKPEMMGKSLIFVALCETSAIYGFVIAAILIFMVIMPMLNLLLGA
jgi:V/A-type H+/Na+-transporting ATPase subunit K